MVSPQALQKCCDSPKAHWFYFRNECDEVAQKVFQKDIQQMLVLEDM